MEFRFCVDLPLSITMRICRTFNLPIPSNHCLTLLHSLTPSYSSHGPFIAVTCSLSLQSTCAIDNHVGGRPRNQKQSKFYPHSRPFPLLSPLIVLLASCASKAPRKRPLLRLPRSVAAMGLTQIRHLHLPRMRGAAPGTWRAHFVRA